MIVAFETFLHEARDCVEAGRRGEVGEGLGALALDAAAWGLPELSSLCGQVARAGVLDPESLAVIEGALNELSIDEDGSGARYDPQPLLTLLDSETVGDGPAAPLEVAVSSEDDGTWRPTVDEDMIDPFLEECNDRLEALTARLIELEQRPDDAELVHAIFRDLHTLKGSSGFVGLDRMKRLSHAAEDLMGLVRDGERRVDRGVIDGLLRTLDVLQAIVGRAADRARIDVDIEPAMRALRSGPGAPSESPRAATAEAPTARVQQTLRIDFQKLDHLMNLVGELVLSKGRVQIALEELGALGRSLEDQRRLAHRNRASRQAPSRRGGVRMEDLATELGRLERAFSSSREDLATAQHQLEFVAGQLRDQVMKLRMLPIGRSWSKYHRTVRQIASELGKRVRLELVGEDTELDKVLVEQLDDPLMHILRNAIDHGLEPPAERTAAGKDPEGVVRLRASHRGGQVVLRIEDDGRGIDPVRIRERAVERGLIEADADLDSSQLVDLIFHAGFSTAEAVSDLSGRGVGMDVVRTAVTRLKGTVQVETTLGGGTAFELRLPLTLAIVQVLLMRVGGQQYAVPLDLVRRTLAPEAAALRAVGEATTILDRDHEVPVLDLRRVLGLSAAASGETQARPIVMTEVGSQMMGLSCDELLGRREIVVKSLGTLLKRVPGVAGATLLGDRVVLILDVPAVIGMSAIEPAVSTARRDEADAPISRGRVLVVEDTEVIRETIRRTLDAAGYEVVVAVDGREGLQRAREGEFDLVCTDVVMPGMDGYELTRALRALPAYRDIPIVMVTSRGDRVDRIRGFDAGVDAYLTKPADADDLLRVVARVLG